MVKIRVNFVFEILGRPKEHIKEALTSLVLNLGNEKGVKLIEKNINEPVEVKDTKDLYTTFAETTYEIDSLLMVLGVIMAYMPAHVEIVEPENINLTNYELNDLTNSLVQKMHNYDAIVKKALMERNILERKLKEVAPQLFKKIEKEQKDSEKVVKEEIKKSDKPSKKGKKDKKR